MLNDAAADLNLLGSADPDLLERAIADDRVLVTENVKDFGPLLEARPPRGKSLVPVVFVLKRSLPTGAGAMSHALAERLGSWCDKYPNPYPHAHWLH